jgi:hypothetical protein
MDKMVALLKMPVTQTYRLHAPQRWEADLGAERRLHERHPISGCVEGRRVDHSIEAQRHPRVSLSLRDMSDGGLSALADLPLMVGERLHVSFPPRGIRRGWNVPGRVLRCRPSGAGYRVAIEFDTVPSAA